MTRLDDKSVEALRRQARILVLLNAAHTAGLAPIGIITFHAFAFLSNVLAPVWDLPVLDGKILKRKGGPFYPALQEDLDRLVGLGMVLIVRVTHVSDADGRWRLEGAYSLNKQMAEPAVNFLLGLSDEGQFASFAQELAFALSTLETNELERALIEDATYSDPATSERNVLDFGEWTHHNPSLNAANYFNRFMPGGTQATPGEKLHLYVRHLHRRFHAG